MELWETVAATYDTGGEVLVTNDVIEGSALRNTGLIRVTTAGGSATYQVLYNIH